MSKWVQTSEIMSTYCPCVQSTTASGAEKAAVRNLWYNKEQHIVPSGNCGGILEATEVIIAL